MENNFTPELIEKARQAQSVEELIALAEANDITITQDEARDYFAQFHKTGELSDDELDNVSGGGCHVKVDGQKYTVVTSNHSCKRYTRIWIEEDKIGEPRNTWMYFSKEGQCGRCNYLKFKGGTGYCGLLPGQLYW